MFIAAGQFRALDATTAASSADEGSVEQFGLRQGSGHER
jgi:hypothetical protein